MAGESPIPNERIEKSILLIRGKKVMIDADLAALYGVTTKQLNQQVKRNAVRFPPDFAFQLTLEEKAEVVTNCDRLNKLKFSPYLPFAFTEHGALMLANVLNSPRQSRQVFRLCVRLFVSVSFWRRTPSLPGGWTRWRKNTTGNSRLFSMRSASPFSRLRNPRIRLASELVRTRLVTLVEKIRRCPEENTSDEGESED